jgi:hypothetical protein
MFTASSKIGNDVRCRVKTPHCGGCDLFDSQRKRQLHVNAAPRNIFHTEG